MARGWPAAATRETRRAEQGGGREGEADWWARARKIKKISLKFKTEMFPSSKIHKILLELDTITKNIVLQESPKNLL